VSSTTGTELVIETSGLRKEFSGKGATRVAVDDLDLAVPRGGVHGFLGPNGSGKTTTIRVLLGLARPTAGPMALFGTPVPDHLDEVIGRVGAVVESPKFSPPSPLGRTCCCSPGRSAWRIRRSTRP
jgi:ABC-2 type transport system ATP-binding protein